MTPTSKTLPWHWSYYSEHYQAVATMAWFLFGEKPLLVETIQAKHECRCRYQGAYLSAIFGEYFEESQPTLQSHRRLLSC